MLYKKALKQLEDLLNDPYVLGKIPYKKGNSIRIGEYVIRKNCTGYLIYNCQTNKKITNFWSKPAALAYVKGAMDEIKCEENIHRLDKTLEKNEIDSMFYRNTIEKAPEGPRKEAAIVRLEIAESNALEARHRLLGLIFDN